LIFSRGKSNYVRAGLHQCAHQGFDTAQSLERLLNTHTKTGTDTLIQSMLVAGGEQDGLFDAQAINEFCGIDGEFVFAINEGSGFGRI
jgi:hypothetical protein